MLDKGLVEATGTDSWSCRGRQVRRKVAQAAVAPSESMSMFDVDLQRSISAPFC